MAALDIDLTLPIVLLTSAIAGVIVVRMLVGRGESLAKERTRRILERHGLRGTERTTSGGDASS